MEKIIQNLINEEKLETALIVDVTEFSEDGKEAIYNYYRGISKGYGSDNFYGLVANNTIYNQQKSQ